MNSYPCKGGRKKFKPVFMLKYMAFLRQIQYNSLLQSFISKSHGSSVLVVTKRN